MSTVRRPTTGLDRARRRRQRRTLAILFAAFLLVVGGGLYAMAYVAGKVPGSRPTPTSSCTPSPTPTPAQSVFATNVYNSSGRTGVATDMAKALKSRRFEVRSVGNDPYMKKLSDAGEIRFGPAGRPYAEKHLAPLLPGARLVQDGRDDNSVDVAIGDQTPAVSAVPVPSITPGC